jgi:hypothetical protein
MVRVADEKLTKCGLKSNFTYSGVGRWGGGGESSPLDLYRSRLCYNACWHVESCQSSCQNDIQEKAIVSCDQLALKMNSVILTRE